MYGEIRVDVLQTDEGKQLIADALSGKDFAYLTDAEKKERQTAEMQAYDKIEADYEELREAIEELVYSFSGNYVAVEMA